jgi:hypothetical protein
MSNFYKINNAMGTAVINGAPVVAKVVASAVLAVVTKGAASVIVTLLTNDGGTSGSAH